VTHRILLEVTEFQESRTLYRHLSGVPRTVMEIGRRLLADETLEVECIFYDAQAGAFFRAPTSLFDAPDDSAPAPGAPRFRAARRLARPIRRWVSQVNGSVRSRLAGPALSLHRSGRRAYLRARGGTPVGFRSTDLVLALGAMWGSRELTDALTRAKRQQGFRVASLVYDTIPIDFPQFFDDEFPAVYRHYLDRVLEISEQLFVISDATARDVARYSSAQHGVLPAVTVIHLGDGAVSAATPRQPDGAPTEPFVLAVSTFEPRKNHLVLYQALKHAQSTGVDLPAIVVAGSPGWLTHDLQHLVRSDPQARGAFVWLPRVTDAELAWLYEHAQFTVFPSIVEGWGLPIAEALTHGKFCVTCDTSSMPEVGGDLVDYVSPWDPAGWVAAIHRYASDPALLAQRTDRIRSEYSPRSWDDTATAVRNALPA
jgi:glycosyltransferase involved in cell wall biosynthesis